MNIILEADSYKYTHHNQYAPATKKIYSYLESRGKSEGIAGDPETVFFGLQPILIKLSGMAFDRNDILEAKAIVDSNLGDGTFPLENWNSLFEDYGGYLPIEIKAVPEGSVVGCNNVLMTITNTDERYAWLVGFLETMLLQVWYPITVATYAHNVKKVILKWLKRNSTSIEAVNFMFHDFGVRGSTSMESAAIGGSAHLLSFRGTDNIPALKFIEKNYGGSFTGLSVPAMEHSTIMSWGESRELDSFANSLKEYRNYPIISILSDTYDLDRCIDNIFADKIQEYRNPNQKIVIRLDSGNAVDNILSTFNKLLSRTYTNEKRYLEFNNSFGILQGDGIDINSIDFILREMDKSGIAASNVVFGCGGKLQQAHGRDDFNFAIKTSYTENEFGNLDISKKTAQKMKRSKSGKLALVKTNWGYATVNQKSLTENDALRLVFKDGHLFNSEDFVVVRDRLNRNHEE